MKRDDFVNRFAKRLKASLEKEGYVSTRSKAGIEMTQLASVAGVSYQMARKYISGLALPDSYMIPKIAQWLNVSPSWLLFGEDEVMAPELKSSSVIEIDLELLREIVQKCTALFPPTSGHNKIANYIVGIIYDVSHINADSKTILKIVDMMLSSAIQLSDIQLEKRA